MENIANSTLSLYNSLPKTGKPKANEWTTLSSIIKEQKEHFSVVSLGTGSKCIGKSKMCPKGTILNDCHAEVMCRRGFMRYLFSELNTSSNIFDVNGRTGKNRLKGGIKFHFFTSHVPCGDAAIFPKKDEDDCGKIVENSSNESRYKSKRRKIEDIYRTGAKCLKDDSRQDFKGEGIDYHVVGVVRTKPGRGDPTQSLSCSDKLAKWCHLGLQGALLMNFLESPIYFDSFTILKGAPFSHEALERALYARLGHVELKFPYKRHVPEIVEVDLDFGYKKVEGKQASDASVVWFIEGTEKIFEVAVNGRRQGVTKKQLMKKGKLKICKRDIFKTFLEKFDRKNLTYKEAKQLSTNYQENWTILKKSFGAWTVKNPELLDFGVS